MASNSISVSVENESEIWLPCKGYETILEVSNLARVKTKDRFVDVLRKGTNYKQFIKGRFLSPCKTRNGYLEVSVVIGEKRIKMRVHRLVAFAFVDGYEKDLSVNHIDGNKLNNSPSNLEWVTLSRNSKHQWETGLVNLRCDNHPSRKLSSGKVRIIREFIKKGVSCNSIAELIDVSPSLIYMIRDKARWSSLPDIA